MPYQLMRLDETPLPLAMPEDDLNTGQVESGLLDSIGSAYNYFGSTAQTPRRMQFAHRGLYVGESSSYRVTPEGDYRVTPEGDYRITSANKIADLADRVDALKRMTGVWAQLWRRRLYDDVETFKWARLLQVRHVEKVEHAGVVSECACTFETLDYAWRDAEVITAVVIVPAGLATALVLVNDGRYPILDASLEIGCTFGAITQVTITAPGVDLTWSGVLSAGNFLTIDSGHQTVPQGAVDAYSGLSFGPGHTSNAWLPLALGTNVYNIGLVGGNATVIMRYRNLWP